MRLYAAAPRLEEGFGAHAAGELDRGREAVREGRISARQEVHEAADPAEIELLAGEVALQLGARGLVGLLGAAEAFEGISGGLEDRSQAAAREDRAIELDRVIYGADCRAAGAQESRQVMDRRVGRVELREGRLYEKDSHAPEYSGLQPPMSSRSKRLRKSARRAVCGRGGTPRRGLAAPRDDRFLRTYFTTNETEALPEWRESNLGDFEYANIELTLPFQSAALAGRLSSSTVSFPLVLTDQLFTTRSFASV